jgi:tetratricopeptide (TPR) repeat protein
VTARLLAWPPGRREARLALQIGVAVVVVLLLAAGGWAWYRARETAGYAALTEALALARAAESQPLSPGARDRAIKALESAIANHPGNPAVSQAAYQLGNLRYAAGQYTGARGAYEAALAKGASDTVGTMARVGIGYTWEAEKNYANAVQAYEKVVRGLGPKDFFFEEALWSLARAQEQAGRAAAAIETYQRILKEVPDSRRDDELRARIAALQGRPKS